MDCKDLYLPKDKVKDKFREGNLKQGYLKKKVVGIQNGLNLLDSTVTVFCSFECMGRFLCFYSNEDKEKMLSYIVVCKILGVNEIADKKDNKFFFEMEDKIKVHLKAETAEEKQSWMMPINYLRKLYSFESPRYGKGVFLEFDPTIYMKIQTQKEFLNWENIKSNFDYTHFIKDKNMLFLFEQNLIENLRNRVALSRATLRIKYKKEKQINKGLKTDKFVVNPLLESMNLKEISYYIFLLNPRVAYVMDQEAAFDDTLIIEKEYIPDWLCFNVLYLFTYKSKGDITGVEMAYHIK